jgi:hypothetical protein
MKKESKGIIHTIGKVNLPWDDKYEGTNGSNDDNTKDD